MGRPWKAVSQSSTPTDLQSGGDGEGSASSAGTVGLYRTAHDSQDCVRSIGDRLLRLLLLSDAALGWRWAVLCCAALRWEHRGPLGAGNSVQRNPREA